MSKSRKKQKENLSDDMNNHIWGKWNSVTEIRFSEQICDGGYYLALFQKRDDGLYTGKIVFEKHQEGTYPHPAMFFPYESKLPEKLKAEATRLGILNIADSGAIKAVQAHLDDMRRLVFVNSEIRGE